MSQLFSAVFGRGGPSGPARRAARRRRVWESGPATAGSVHYLAVAAQQKRWYHESNSMLINVSYTSYTGYVIPCYLSLLSPNYIPIRPLGHLASADYGDPGIPSP